MLNASPNKKELRRLMRDKRAALHAQMPDAPAGLCKQFLENIELPKDAVIAGYVALDHEIDPAPLMAALHARGFRLALPAMHNAAKDTPLAFRSYKPGDHLISGYGNVSEPISTAPEIEPDIILVPLLAFDTYGHRLGRGGGHYDRTLENMRKRRKIEAIGLAYGGQQLAAIPAESHDARLDKIITQTEVILVLNPC